MTTETNDSKVIRKKDERFPDWLDFDKLRSEGIDHLGKLSGNIWTDHNTHDPGITILEMLCYALLDLGYRTTLPANDLFAPDPENKNGNNDFLTPSLALGNNPLTILDYRRLLIDIPGIKNAWLEVDDWLEEDLQVDKGRLPCNRMFPPMRGKTDITAPDSYSFLNGLYHVYIDLERNIATGDGNKEADAEFKTIKQAVAKALLSHRNLCEDFIDLTILCKQEIGVSAEIELEPDANPEKVNLAIIESLRDFFSPAPRFYTLQTLLDKGKKIEDIYSGRPYDIKQSHGFVDPGEFENIVLKKEIHVSDVYHTIFDVPGVAAVKNLKIKSINLPDCSDNRVGEGSAWIFKLHKNHVPEFKADVSLFSFFRNSIKLNIVNRLIPQLSSMGKAIYQSPSPYLDAATPGGIYRADLDEYFSIQNEFPAVYKLGEGQLPDSVPDERKSKAYQLKGYLLFFDQLLADYLSQLKNVRSLLSLSQAASAGDEHSYFINTMQTVPDMDKLTRFQHSKGPGNLQEGKILAIPVNKKSLLELVQNEKIKESAVKKLATPYLFGSAGACKVAMRQLMEDLACDDCLPSLFKTVNGCHYYYFITSSEEIAVLGKSHYPDEKQARRNADMLQISSVFAENYRTYVIAADQTHSFDLEFNLCDHYKALQLLSEDKQLFGRRKQQFMDHLLARFAERFTDFAMLSYGMMDEDTLTKHDIAFKKRFITSYPELSSNRGKAYDYKRDGWNSPNISGIEKRFCALTGIEKWERASHCHFDVVPYERQVYTHISDSIGQWEYDILKGADKFDESDGADAFFSLAKALPDISNYKSRLSGYGGKEEIFVQNGLHRYDHAGQFEGSDTQDAIRKLHQLFTQEPGPEEPSSYNHFLSFEDLGQKPVKERRSAIPYPEKELPITSSIIKEINDGKEWKKIDPASADKDFLIINNPDRPKDLINKKVFEIEYQNADIKDESLAIRFAVYPKGKKAFFLFHSTSYFDTKKEAAHNADLFLFQLADEKNYNYIEKIKDQFVIHIIKDGVMLAVDSIEYESYEAARNGAQRIMGYVHAESYRVVAKSVESKWRFTYPLSYPGQYGFIFASKKEYTKQGEATEAARRLTTATEGYTITKNSKNELEIRESKDLTKKGELIAFCELPADKPGTDFSLAESLFELKFKMNGLVQKPETYREKYVVSDEVSTKEAWVYRLYRKNDYQARYLPAAGSVTNDHHKAIKEIVKKFPANYIFLEISFGGNMVRERKNAKTGKTSYHYEIKCRNRFYKTGKELVLFESVKGYNSIQEAHEAFTGNYMTILGKAVLKESYTEYISFKEILEDDCTPRDVSKSVVFIPNETMEFYDNHDGNAMKHLMLHANSFPVKAIKKTSKEFKDLFGCTEAVCDEKLIGLNCMETTIEKDVFYFLLSEQGKEPETITDAWISDKYFDTVEEALTAFAFLLVLLRYKGNYRFEQDCNCKWQLFAHEILAVSERKFAEKKLAWGPEGVERFIAVSQSELPFHAYFDKETCRYTYYIACSGTGLIHSRKYDTAKKRDQAMEKLYGAAKNDLFIRTAWEWSSLSSELRQELLTLENIKKDALSVDQVIDVLSSIASGKFVEELNRMNEEVRKQVVDFTQNYTTKWQWQWSSLSIELQQALLILANIKKDSLSIDQVLNLMHDIVSGKFDEDLAKLNETVKMELAVFIRDYPLTKQTDKTKKSCYDIRLTLPAETLAKEIQDGGCGETEKNETICSCQVAWETKCCFENSEKAAGQLKAITELLKDISIYKAIFDCACGGYGIRIQWPCPDLTVQKKNKTRSAGSLPCWNEMIATSPQYYPSPVMTCDAIKRAKDTINDEGLHLVEHILLRPYDENECDYLIPSCPGTKCDFDWPLNEDDHCKDKRNKSKIRFIPGQDPYSFIATVVLPAWPLRFRKKENRLLLENILQREAPAHIMVRVLWLRPADLCEFEYFFRNWVREKSFRDSCSPAYTKQNFIEFLFRKKFDCLPDQESCGHCGVTPSLEYADHYKWLHAINTLYCWGDMECRTPGFVKPGFVNERFRNYKMGMEQLLEKVTDRSFKEKSSKFLEAGEPKLNQYSLLIKSLLSAKEKSIISAKQAIAGIITSYYIDTISFKSKDREMLRKTNDVFIQMREAGIDMHSIFEKWGQVKVQTYQPGTDVLEVYHLLTGNK
ncbi:MAG TPA: hypothetical protein VGO58_02985 [Chitinophagaceae bacterium]|jgi:hypothetical protein|nr:hypothetical protein [Chitinophagaceae bacterium]